MNELEKLKQQLTFAQERVKELEAYVDRLCWSIFNLCVTCVHIGKPCDRTANGVTTSACSDYVDETPILSLNHIRAEVEEETIERCELQVRTEHRLVAVNGSNYSLRQLKRKYSAVPEQNEGE